MYEAAGYLSALLIGISLGLIGSGGSILTVPLLVYLFGLDAITATAYSLFIVGATSISGALQNLIRGEVNLKVVVIFAVPSLISVYLVRRFLMPLLPDPIFHLGGMSPARDQFIMVTFALIMFLSAVKMLVPGEERSPSQKGFNYGLILLEGIIVGGITGFVGAGGGFLIVPALVLLTGLSMKKAVATSLLIIASKSLIGFIGDLQLRAIQWDFLLTITAISIAGVFIGLKLLKFVPGGRLKSIFGWFVLLMSLAMVIQEVTKA